MTRKTLTICLIFLISASTYAQDFNLSATAGYLNLNSIFKVNGDKRDLDIKSSGFYFGAQTEINLAEKISLHPELVIGVIDEGNTLYLGALGSYNVAESFQILFGPSFNYLLEDVFSDYGKFGIFATLGGKYNISDKVSAQAKYGIQLNDFYKGSADVSSKVNYLLIGIVYRIL